MQTKERAALEALAQALAEKARGERPKPKLRVVTTPRPTKFDAITRDHVLRRIRTLSKAYRLAWLIEQNTFNQPSIDTLEDQELSELLSTLERARECIAEGIPFEDAGLVQSTLHHLPDVWD